MRILVAITIVLACQRAYAESPPPEPVGPPVVASYRGATLAADGVALGLLAVGVVSGPQPLVVIGASTYVVGAPIVHVTKGRYGRAAGSLAMRVGLPLLGLVIGASLPRDCGPTGDCIESPPLAAYVGLGAGAVAASALDTIFLANGDPPRSSSQTAWTPVVGPTRGGVALGVAGQF